MWDKLRRPVEPSVAQGLGMQGVLSPFSCRQRGTTVGGGAQTCLSSAPCSLEGPVVPPGARGAALHGAEG